MQHKSGIYKIANIETGDFYVGSAVNLKRFCKKNNLSTDCMYKVIKNKNKSHKGYTNAN